MSLEDRQNSAPEDKPVVPPDTARLLRSQAALREELMRLEENGRALAEQLGTAVKDGIKNRLARRAALNLMEDSVLARQAVLAANEQLRERIREREVAEEALPTSEAKLEAAQEEFRQLSTAFDLRVLERTRELQEREQRLRDLAAELKRKEGKERQRLARLLHDHVQQLLVAARMRLEYLAGEVHESQREEMSKVGKVLNDAIQATRDLSVQLTPPMLHEQGLPAALEWLVARASREHGFSITASIDPDANPADEEERDILFQAAQEFLLNAAKYAGTPNIEFEIDRSPNWIRLEVRDAGAGFDATRQTDCSFGLLQLKQRLEGIGGVFSVDSSPGHGTRAVAAVATAAAPAEREEVGDLYGLLASSLDDDHHDDDRITVVLVDDHPLVRDGLTDALRRTTDIHIDGEAGDGSSGLELVLAERPNVVLMDINMPIMNGIEATRRILAQLPTTKVIGLSLEEGPEAGRKMLDAGAVRYVVKTGTTSDIIAAIRSVFAETA